jgi:hypothetical protein
VNVLHANRVAEYVAESFVNVTDLRADSARFGGRALQADSVARALQAQEARESTADALGAPFNAAKRASRPLRRPKDQVLVLVRCAQA